MQVIILPAGTGASRRLRIHPAMLAALGAALLLAVAAGGAWLGYGAARELAAVVPDSPIDALPVPARLADADYAPMSPLQAPGRDGSPDAVERPVAGPAAARDQVVNHRIVGKFAAAAAGQMASLKVSLDAQQRELAAARRGLDEQLDSLGQRVGRIQAQVARINALGRRLTELAGIDPAEFNFNALPAMGGPARPLPWTGMRAADMGQTLARLERELHQRDNALQALEALLGDRALHAQQFPQGWPTTSGWVSSVYGKRSDPFSGHEAFHEGVDIAARAGSKIRAMAAGVVSVAGVRPGYGRMIEINHGNGYATRYAHASRITAQVGERVAKGEVVGRVGSSGRSTGSHVHVEVLENGKVVNPRRYLQAGGATPSG